MWKKTFSSILGKRMLDEAGVPADKIHQDPCVLGVHFRGRQDHLNTSKEAARLQTATKLIGRFEMLPVSCQWRKRVIATQGLGKAAIG